MTSTIPLLVVLALAVVTGAPGALAAPGPVLPADASAVGLLERAREAAAAETFSGLLVVEWHDGKRMRSAEVPVRSAGGVLRLGDEVVGTGARRLVRSNGGWLTLWAHDVIALGPSPTVKYRMSVTPGPLVAGRETDMVEVRVTDEDPVRERLYFDRSEGLLLRRELLDARGERYRSVGFVRISAEAPVVAAAAPARATHQQPAAPARRLDDPYDAPERLGAGYRLVGAYNKPGGVLHLFYSDGLYGLSVFEQRGRLKTGSMPRGEKRMELAGHPVRAWSTSVGETVVWEGDGIVYTVVSDAPWTDVAAAVGDLPHAESPKRLRRVAEAVVSLFRWR